MTRYPYSDWPYSVEYSIANPPAVDGYQVMLTIPWKKGMRQDFRDIRFRDPTLRKCAYWIETATASSTANVWVRLYSGQKRLFLLFGNGKAVSESSGTAVFDFFDDFSGAAIDTTKWDTSGTVTLTNGVMVGHISGKTSFGAGYSLCGTVRWTTINAGGQRNFAWVNVADSESYYCFNGHTSGQWILECNSPYHYSLYMGTMDTNFHKWEIRRASPSSCDFYRDGSYKGSLSNGPTANLPPGIVTGTGEWKTVYVRKFAAIEPALTRARSGLNSWGILASRNPLTAGSPPPTYSETATVSLGVSAADTTRTAYHSTASVNLGILTKGRDPVNYVESASVNLGVSASAASTAGYHASASVNLGVSTPVATIIQTIDFSGTKAGASTVKRGITDMFWTLDQPIDEAKILTASDQLQTKLIGRDKSGIEHCVFFGLLPDISRQLAFCADSTSVTGYDYAWYLSEQKVPADLVVMPATTNPTDYIRALLGGDSWESVTGVMPYRLHTCTEWGTPTLPAKEFPFTRDTTKAAAINEILEYIGGWVFFTKWQNFGPDCSVDSPDPSRRLVVISAADYDSGGQGVGYSDHEPTNLGGAYRPDEGVDLEQFATESGVSVGWIRDGEWLRYTRDIPWTGRYAVSFRVAAMGPETYFDVFFDGSETAAFRIHVGRDYLTGDYSIFTNTNSEADGSFVDLTAGTHTMKIVFGGNIGEECNDKHQNLARITFTPRPAATEGTLTDDVFTPAAYLLREDELDSLNDGLDLPNPRAFTNPDDSIMDKVKIGENSSLKYNRVIVGGHDAAGVWFWVTRETPAVTAKQEKPREHSEKPDQCTTVALTEQYADNLLAYYQNEPAAHQMKIAQGLDLQLYQKVRFIGYEKIPDVWYRIVDITYHCDWLDDYAEISVLPATQMFAQKRLYRALFPTSTSNTEAIVNSIVTQQPGILVGTVQSVSNGSAVVSVESGGTQTWRCT